MSNKQEASSIASSPPWAELPQEITANILQRLGTIELLESAQRVCTAWWKVCHDPTVWSVVDLKYIPFTSKEAPVLEEICRTAVDRSQGQLLQISIQYFGDKHLLNYIAHRSSQLRHLRLVKCYNRLSGALAVAAKNFPLLEELHIYFTYIAKDDLEIVGRSCPLLKSFILHAGPFDKLRFPPSEDNHKALAIASSMPELRHLALIDHNLTNEGLQAILDGCPHLESLDLRGCSCIDLEGDLGRRCRQQIVDLKHSRDSPCDCEFDYKISY
ncbi:putative F-box/LRR-repeat protein 23 [Lycium barbarum]|uniref:putative F-box/LRR-repeat protein 23 n=1 Tax=Lycium barbarum TaxID=112863 RepID=UPI00293EB662|nr:putative F-box/LRR-repeat protein 23 [Lycium barbarum]